MDAEERRDLTSWMIRLADGDRGAFRPMFEKLWPMFRRFAGRMLGDGPDAEDAAQQALCRVFERAPEFDPNREALPWLLAIAANECRTLRRKNQRRRECAAPSDDEPSADGRSPEDETLSRDLEAALYATLESLRPTDVATIEAVMGIGTNATGVAPATFRKRLERAIGRLRIAFRGRHGSL